MKGKTGLTFLLEEPFGTLRDPNGSYSTVLQSPLFVLLSYPSLVTTALLLRVVCAVHMHHAGEIVESIRIADRQGEHDDRRVDRHLEQFALLREGLQTTGKRWQWLLFVQILIFISLATIPFCQLWRDRMGYLQPTKLSSAYGGEADDWNELTMIFAQFCPLGLSILSIMGINSKLEAIPGDLTRNNLMSAGERNIFRDNYMDLELGIYVFSVRLTTSRLMRGILTVAALLLFSKFKSVLKV